MPWRLVLFLTTLVLAAFFIGFNLDNRCDVSLVLYTFKDVPIFVSLLVAFVAGSLAVIPFLVGHSVRASRGSKESRGSRGSREGRSSRRSTADTQPGSDNPTTRQRSKNFREADD